jgi:hypothetical protein
VQIWFVGRMAWTYDAARAPDPELWQALEEADKIKAVIEHHRALKTDHAHLPSPQAHAAMHVVVENQLVEDEPFAARVTLKRLMDGGLNRHEAVHAIGIVASRRLFGMLQSKEKWDNDAYVRELNAMTPEPAIGTVRVKN